MYILTDHDSNTEDWSNGCWKFSFAISGINLILQYIQIEKLF